MFSYIGKFNLSEYDEMKLGSGAQTGTTNTRGKKKWDPIRNIFLALWMFSPPASHGMSGKFSCFYCWLHRFLRSWRYLLRQ